MRIVLLGPPGAGKGTQAAILTDFYKVLHLATGDLLREEVAKGSTLGLEAKGYMEKGELVPDTLVIDMVINKLDSKEAQKGFILDGFPRNVSQAEAFGKRLDENKINLDAVIYLETSEDVIVKRLSGRRVCKKCGAVYHTINMPSKVEGICDKCGGQLYQRKDDTVETIKNRLDVYNQQTAALIDYYKKEGKLFMVSGDMDAQKLFSELKEFFTKQNIA
jgi:adenylate kinase